MSYYNGFIAFYLSHFVAFQIFAAYSAAVEIHALSAWISG